MAQFKIGDLVECVDASPGRHSGLCLVLGALYTITRFEPLWYDGAWDDSAAACDVEECPAWRPDFNALWSAHRFRLIHRPRADFIEALKALPAEPEAVSA